MTDPAPLPPPLAQFAGAPVPAPDWFADALAAPFETGETVRDGVRLVWKAWGRRGDPALVLIHGGTAHKGWWDALGPFLAQAGRRVIAPDLAGMGQSGWREVYTMTDHAADMRAAAEDAGAFENGKPVFVGHSFGGFVTLQAATEFGADLRAAVILDRDASHAAAARSILIWRPRWRASACCPPSPATMCGWWIMWRAVRCAKPRAAGPGGSIPICGPSSPISAAILKLRPRRWAARWPSSGANAPIS